MRFRFYENKSDEKEVALRIISERDIRSVIFHIIRYDELNFNEHKTSSLTEFQTILSSISSSDDGYCTWINIEGIHRKDILDELSIPFNLHKLVIEDIVTMNVRMKLDLLDNNSSIYLLMKMIYMDPNVKHIKQEQISFLLKENNFLITFQEAKDPKNTFDIFQVVKHRLNNNRGRIRSLKIDYLFYCLLDVLIENYMIVLDRMSSKIDQIDKLLLNKLKNNKNVQVSSNDFNLATLKLIYHMKHDMLSFRILCQPLREIIIKLQKAQNRISRANESVHSRRQYRRKKRPKHIPLSANYFYNPNSNLFDNQKTVGNVSEKEPIFNEYIYMYFKDLNDHIIQLHDRIDTYCDVLSGLTSFYMILNDADMNRIMTFLTLVSAIFIPMTFILGLFSVNIINTPPLRWQVGYFLVLGALGICAIFMISWFKFKKWL